MDPWIPSSIVILTALEKLFHEKLPELSILCCCNSYSYSYSYIQYWPWNIDSNYSLPLPFHRQNPHRSFYTAKSPSACTFMSFPSTPDSRQLSNPSPSLSKTTLSQSRESGDVLPVGSGNAPEVAAVHASPFAKSWAHFFAGGYSH